MRVKVMAHDELENKEIFIGAVITNHSMSVEEALDLIVGEKQEVIKEHGWDNLYTELE